MNEFQQAVEAIKAEYSKQRQAEDEKHKSVRLAEEARHVGQLQLLKEAKKNAIEGASLTFQLPTPVQKKRMQIAYRLQAAIKAIVQEWGGRDVYDYKSASCEFYEPVSEQESGTMAFTVHLPFKEPAEPVE